MESAGIELHVESSTARLRRASEVVPCEKGGRGPPRFSLKEYYVSPDSSQFILLKERISR